MPATGSSTSISLGFCASSMPISSHCFWPWLSRAPSMCCCGPMRMIDRISSSRSFSALLGVAVSSRYQLRMPASASRRLSRTVWFSNTVGFWNLRPMPSVAMFGLVELGEVGGAVEHHLALVRPGLAGDDVHHGGLAGAVGTDDRAHLARLDQQRKIVQRLEAVERDGDAAEIEQRRGGAHMGDVGRLHAVALALRSRARLVSWFHRPTTPLGSSSVTTMNSAPSANSQTSGSAPVR